MLSHHPALQYPGIVFAVSCWTSGMDGGVAGATDHEGLALSRRHHLQPARGLLPPWSPEVLEGADVVDFELVGSAATGAAIRQQAVHHLASRVPRAAWGIGEGCAEIPVQRRPSPRRHGRWLAVPRHADLESHAWPAFRLDAG